MRATEPLLIAALLFALIGCDSWGRKEGYQLIPNESREASTSASAAEVERLTGEISDTLTIVASKYNLKRVTNGYGLLVYSVPDFEGKNIERGSISVNAVVHDGVTRVSLALNQFGTVWPYGEKIFDETVNLLNQKYGVVLSIDRRPH